MTGFASLPAIHAVPDVAGLISYLASAPSSFDLCFGLPRRTPFYIYHL